MYLLIEVAVTTLDHKKLTTHAKAGIGEAWIVNPEAYRSEVYRQPKGSRYLVRVDHNPGQPIAPLAFPNRPLEPSW
ncbi:MAG TPA: Uma2 family endonuclease [Meiothermus sp.]|nr:Uma2 family endonuclease [Meiothermus sp.]